MALTRDLGLTVAARARRDPKFRRALLTEAINTCRAGDTHTGKAMPRDLVSVTVGFEGLVAKSRKSSKSLRHMPV